MDVGSRIPCNQRLFQRNKHLSVFRFRRFVRPEFPMAGVDILQALFIVDLQICTHFVACKKSRRVRIDKFRRQCEIACKSFGNFYFDLCPVQSEDGLKPVYLFLWETLGFVFGFQNAPIFPIFQKCDGFLKNLIIEDLIFLRENCFSKFLGTNTNSTNLYRICIIPINNFMIFNTIRTALKTYIMTIMITSRSINALSDFLWNIFSE